MTFRSRILAAAICALSAGCATGGVFPVDPLLDAEISGGDFSAHLAREYQRRTGVEKLTGARRAHARRLARKGFAAMRGKPVLPWDPEERKVAANELPELTAARARLMSALDGGGRPSFAQACARAQVWYDGWLDQSRGRGARRGDAAFEKAAFFDAIPDCEGVIDPNKFVVYFGWDRVNLTEAADVLVGEIAAAAARFRVADVLVEGHADSSGPARLNMALAEKRARAVADALRGAGVTVTGVRWYGEALPARPMGEGAREPLNRRVEITLSR